MNSRQFLAIVGLVWGVLAVTFWLESNLFQAAVSTLASLVAFSLVWWYTTQDEHTDL